MGNQNTLDVVAQDIAQDMLELLIDMRETPPPADWKERRDRLISEARNAGFDTSTLSDRAERWG